MEFPQFWNNPEFSTLSKGLAVLTSMITPALLFSATGTFLISTSQRLGRCVDRIRKISDIVESGIDFQEKPLTEARKAMLLRQVEFLGRRARILTRVMQRFYVASGSFVGTSVSIGIASLFVQTLSWLPITLGLLGASFLMIGSLELIVEARLSAAGLLHEIEFMEATVKQSVAGTTPAAAGPDTPLPEEASTAEQPAKAAGNHSSNLAS